jgi:hypothetical protein
MNLINSPLKRSLGNIASRIVLLLSIVVVHHGASSRSDPIFRRRFLKFPTVNTSLVSTVYYLLGVHRMRGGAAAARRDGAHSTILPYNTS